MKTQYFSIFQVSVVASLLLLVYACGSGGNRALVSEEAQPAAEGSEQALRYVVQTESSYVTWTGSKISEKHYGKIGMSEGMFFVEEGQITSGSVTIDLQTLSVAHPDAAEETEKLRNHLLSKDFFETETYPTAYFELVSLAPYDASTFQDREEYESTGKPATASEHMVESPTHNITGNLTIRGTKRSITFPGRIDMSEGSFTVAAKFNIDRTEWGVSYGDENSVIDKAKDKFIYNTVNVGFMLNAQMKETTSTEETPTEDLQ